MSEWISISVQLPTPDDNVIAYDMGCVILSFSDRYSNKYEWVDEYGTTYSPTHWMPLPSPPEDGE